MREMVEIVSLILTEMEDLQHDLLPGAALQSSQRGEADLAWLTVRVSRAVGSMLGLRHSAGPQIGTADWGGQAALAHLGALNIITARLPCRSSVRSALNIVITPQTTSYNAIPQ